MTAIRHGGARTGLLWKLLLIGLAAVGVVFLARAQSPSSARISAPVDSRQMSAVHGNVHPLARAEFDRGAVDGSMKLEHVTLVFKPTPAQQAALDKLLADQQDRSSPSYHRWLTPEQYAEQFGLNQADLDKVSAWLESQGLQVELTARSRTSMVFSGTAAQIAAALHTEIHHYTINGEAHFANASDPQVPVAFAGVVMGFRGLDDFKPKARALHARATVAAQPRFSSSVSPSHFIAPPDFATIYNLNPLYTNNINGTGQKIAVMGQTDVVMNDIATFRSLSGLPANLPSPTNCNSTTNICTGLLISTSDPGEQIATGDLSEADLDLEWAGAVAPNATIIYVNSGTANGVFDSFQYAVENSSAPVISNSYGICEPEISQSEVAMLQQLAQQANSKGITVIAPSGDSGATDCDLNLPATIGLAVDFPGSLPNVTSVGGTEFNEGSGSYWATANGTDVVSSALSYIPEIVWNDTLAIGQPSAGGGGASALFAKPNWQTVPGVPNDGARDVPDISIAASPNHDGYLICTQVFANGSPTASSSCTNNTFRYADSTQPQCNPDCLAVFGGTSMGVPTFAGVIALVNELYPPSAPLLGQGNVNPTLYALSAKPSVFHDITSGNNSIPFEPATLAGCSSATTSVGYNAGTGYDLATGLGSVDANNLVTQWTSVTPTPGTPAAVDFQLGFTSNVVAVRRGTCGTATLVVSPTNNFSGIPNFTCTASSALGTTSCTVTQSPTASLVAPPVKPRFDWRMLLPVFLICTLLYAVFDRMRRAQTATANGISPALPKLVPRLAFTLLLAVIVGCGGSGGSNNSGTGGTANTSGTTLTGPRYTVTIAVPASTASGTGTVTVTANIGTISHTANINVTAQ